MRQAPAERGGAEAEPAGLGGRGVSSGEARADKKKVLGLQLCTQPEDASGARQLKATSYW